MDKKNIDFASMCKVLIFFLIFFLAVSNIRDTISYHTMPLKYIYHVMSYHFTLGSFDI